MRGRLLLASSVLAAICPGCTPRGNPPDRIATPVEGMSIMVYASTAGSGVETTFGVVDDRRWIEVTGDSITLDRIDPAAPLPSLVIEPIGGGDLRIGTCVRERIDPSAEGLQRLVEVRGHQRSRVPTDDEDRQSLFDHPAAPVGVLSPLVRCSVTSRRGSGRHLVRVLHVAPAIRYRTQHDVTMIDADHATITTRFALATPAWSTRATVALFDGLPGGGEPPHEVAHGTVVLDGGTAVLTIPPRTVGAKLRRVFDGAVRDRDTPATDPAWGNESRRAVWVWLELEGTMLASGPVRVHLEGDPPRDVVVSSIDRERLGKTTRLPLWVDDALHGARRHWIERSAQRLVQRFQLSVSNASDAPREVWIEERLRPARRRDVTRAWPSKPVLTDDVARTKLVVPAGGTERINYTLTYEL